MISYVRGELISIENEKVIVEVQGVGLGIYMPMQSVSLLPPVGEEVRLHTYMNVREDAIQLFGFLTKDDLNIFKQVITVSGIGPKGGLNILSHLSSDDLRFAIMANDAKTIASTPGIGKKTAEKLIIELKDKMKIEEILDARVEHNGLSHEGGTDDVQKEAIQALVALGYGSTDAMKAIKKVQVHEYTTVEELLKLALKNIMF